MPEKFRVTSESLNLRSAPDPTRQNRIATLPQGAAVEKLAVSSVADWWRVAVTLQGARVEGFVNSRHLAPAGSQDPTPAAQRVGPVHLAENSASATRDSASRRAFPIGEPGRPARLAGAPAQRQAGLLAIIDWLDVERGERWRPGASTFCNIYAYDVCYLAGIYMPRVWWTDRALARLSRGEPVVPRYDDTVRELNANALTDWFEDHGEAFGWRRSIDLDEMQSAANAGRLAVIVAQNSNLNRSGHIQIVAPEHDGFAARRRDGRVANPLQSQAGRRNFRYGTLERTPWWPKPGFRKHGLWICG